MNSDHNNEISSCITSLEKATDALEGEDSTEWKNNRIK